MKTDYESLKIEIDGHVMIATLNRPEVLNRVDEPAHVDLITLFNELRFQEEYDIRAIVLASTGKVFSAGGDLNIALKLNKDAKAAARVNEQGRLLYNTLIDVSIPIVVALHGDAHGMGANIVLACDAVVASKNARLSDSHVKVGMVAGDGGLVSWPNSMGVLRAKRHLLTGDMVTAEQGYAWGIITDLVDTPEQVLPAARALADKIAALPPVAVQLTKKSFNRLLQQRAGEVFELSLAYEGISMKSEDLVEAVKSFLEKRKPTYHGK
jgi:enoyl-CoA hydratase